MHLTKYNNYTYTQSYIYPLYTHVDVSQWTLKTTDYIITCTSSIPRYLVYSKTRYLVYSKIHVQPTFYTHMWMCLSGHSKPRNIYIITVFGFRQELKIIHRKGRIKRSRLV